MRKVNAMVVIATAFVLAAPCIALADKKKVNAPKQIAPRENITFTYTKPQFNYYTQQRRYAHRSPARYASVYLVNTVLNAKYRCEETHREDAIQSYGRTGPDIQIERYYK